MYPTKEGKRSLKFAFLVLEEHPYGREMLAALIENGLIPALIIQEVSAVGDEERQKFFDRIEGQPKPARINQLVNQLQVPIYSVANHNNEVCEQILRSFEPDLVVLGGTRIIKNNILSIGKLGTLNCHPGLLPELRGSSSSGWALYNDLPQGATAHFIDPGIDTGDIVRKEQLSVVPGDTFESINYKLARLAGKLMAEAIAQVISGIITRTPQDTSTGTTYRVIPEELLAIGKQRLANGSYSHFAQG